MSIVGPSGLGKSNMLNFMFGTNLKVTRIKSTKSGCGVTATLIRTDFAGTKEILLLDTRGLFEANSIDS